MGAQIRFPFSNGVCNSDAKVQIGHTYMNCEFYTIVHKIAEKTETENERNAKFTECSQNTQDSKETSGFL